MTLAISIIGGAAVLAAALALFFWQRQKRAVWTRYRKAAQRIIREEYLDASIGKTEYGAARPVPRKLMVALEIKGARGKGYVFDPEREIRIGRSLESSDLCLPDTMVSSQHSRIFLWEGQVCIQDMDSANGTVVQQGLGLRRTLWGQAETLRDKARIQVGNTDIRIRIFSCEVSGR